MTRVDVTASRESNQASLEISSVAPGRTGKTHAKSSGALLYWT